MRMNNNQICACGACGLKRVGSGIQSCILPKLEYISDDYQLSDRLFFSAILMEISDYAGDKFVIV